jgi:hypothetical protein
MRGEDRWRDRPGDGVFVPAGLWPAAAAVLRCAGYRLPELAAAPALPEPDWNDVRRQGCADAPLLDLVRHRPLGLVRYGATVDVARLVAQVALAWPGLRVIVACAQRDAAWGLWQRLRPFLPDVVVAAGKRPCPAVRQVAVATFPHMADLEFFGRRRDIVIVADALTALGEAPWWGLVASPPDRLYGLLPRHATPAPYDADCLAEIFGLDEVVLPRHGQRELRVEWALARPVGGPALAPDLDVLETKRQGLWRQPRRNRRVAHLALALAEGNGPRVLALCPEATNAAPVGGEAGSGVGRRVVVIVEGLDHAAALAGHLPEWPVIAGPEVNAPSELGEALRRGRDVDPQDVGRAVVTAEGARGLGLAVVDVLVRADGGAGLPPLPPGALDVPASRERPLLLIDCDDRHHPRLRTHARRRREAYVARGWARCGTNISEAAALRFLLGRRERGVFA